MRRALFSTSFDSHSERETRDGRETEARIDRVESIVRDVVASLESDSRVEYKKKYPRGDRWLRTTMIGEEIGCVANGN